MQTLTDTLLHGWDATVATRSSPAYSTIGTANQTIGKRK